MKLKVQKEITNNKLNILDHEEEIDLILSYSKISDFDRNGGISLIRNNFVENNGIKLGTIVDDILFNDKEYIDKNYYIFDGEKPNATLGVLCDIILKNYDYIPKKEEIIDIIKFNKFWNSTKNEELLIKQFDKDEFWNYIKSNIEAKDKILLTTSEYHTALDLVSILKEHPYSKKILNNNYENIYQLKFQIEYNKFKIRGIIDIISIDHENKIVYFTDLKTGKNPSIEFQESFIKWRYYIQSAVYKLAFDEICTHFNLKNYKLASFQFLYISKSDKIPLLYIVTEKWDKASFKGFKLDGVYYKGLDELLDEIYWCWKNKEYTIPKFIADNNGVVNLNDNFIIINE